MISVLSLSATISYAAFNHPGGFQNNTLFSYLAGLSSETNAQLVEINNEWNTTATTDPRPVDGPGGELSFVTTSSSNPNNRFNAGYALSTILFDPVVFFAGGTTDSETRFKNDAAAAYYLALRTVRTGNYSYVNKSRQIIDYWVLENPKFVNAADNCYGTLKGCWNESTGECISGDYDICFDAASVEAAWYMTYWANAYEIIDKKLGLSLWDGPESAASKRTKFRDWLSVQHDVVTGVDSGEGDKVNNRSVARAVADMYFGLVLDTTTLSGKSGDQWFAEGSDKAMSLLYGIISLNGGIEELPGRDCRHPQYSMMFFAHAAMLQEQKWGAGSNSNKLIHRVRSGDNTGVPILVKGLNTMAQSLRNGTANTLYGISPGRDCHPKAGAEPKYDDRFIDGWPDVFLYLYKQDLSYSGTGGGTVNWYTGDHKLSGGGTNNSCNTTALTCSGALANLRWLVGFNGTTRNHSQVREGIAADLSSIIHTYYRK